MKYIRTKDGRIIESALLRHCDCPFEQWFINETDISWNENPELKSADTIEELCDVVVIVGKRYNEPYHWWFLRHTGVGGNNLVEIVKNYLELWGVEDYMIFENIYGAVWTDKGLNYVAKLNDKRELELL